jgi:PAS domain S-box-containing protein
VFTQDAEDIVAAIAVQAGPAIDSARLKQTSRRLAAVIASCHDAIYTIDCDGLLTSWNAAAQRLFGYAPEEIIGQPVTLLMAADRKNEEPSILGRIQRGERVDHYETVRSHKDGTLVDISLTVSPIKDDRDRIVGASKIARDIGERKRADEQKNLLIAEIEHRVKNTLATVQALAALTLKSPGSWG